jgi:hypothetical protein
MNSPVRMWRRASASRLFPDIAASTALCTILKATISFSVTMRGMIGRVVSPGWARCSEKSVCWIGNLWFAIRSSDVFLIHSLSIGSVHSSFVFVFWSSCLSQVPSIHVPSDCHYFGTYFNVNLLLLRFRCLLQVLRMPLPISRCLLSCYDFRGLSLLASIKVILPIEE